jgi:hypothetical protein
VVEHLPHHYKDEGLSASDASGTRIEKVIAFYIFDFKIQIYRSMIKNFTDFTESF